jgi:hypothetical protein
MAERITVFQTQTHTIRERIGGDIWTVELTESNNTIGEIVLFPASEPYTDEWVFNAFFNTFNRAELLELAEAIERIDNITKSDG